MKRWQIVAVLLLSLIATFLVPGPTQASPEGDAWDRYPLPEKGRAGGWVLTSDVTSETTGVTAISVARDGTIYAATREISGSPLNGYNLFKSTDDGYSWTPLWQIPDSDNPGGSLEAIALVLPQPDDAGTLYLATRYNVYRSRDGGERFTRLSQPPLTTGLTPANSALISSLDVTGSDGKHLVLVSTGDADPLDYGGVYLYDEGRPFTPWADLRAGEVAAGSSYDVAVAAFSPGFADDQQVVAVITDETNTIITTRVGAARWGDTVGDAVLPGLAASGGSIAFPADYECDVDGDTYSQYVGLNDGGFGGGIFTITGAAAPDNSVVTPLLPVPVHTLDFVGETISPTIVAGLTNGGLFYLSSTAATGFGGDSIDPEDFSGGLANTPPSAPPAVNTCVAIGEFHGSGYFVYAGTSGIGGGFARSVDSGANFARTSLICDDLMTVTDMAVSPVYDEDDTIYIITEGHSGSKLLWRTTSRGETWDAVLTEGQLLGDDGGDVEAVGDFDKVTISPKFATDTTLFIGESEAGPDIWRSTENGSRFWLLPLKPTTAGIDAWAAAGIKKLLVGDSGGNFYRTTNNGLTWREEATGLSGFSSLRLSPDYENDETILAADDSGSIFLSTDDGETWQRPVADDAGMGGGTTAAFSPYFADDSTIYAADSATDSGILRLIIGEDREWRRIDRLNPGRVEEVAASTTGLHIAEDGDGLSVLYATSADPVAERAPGTSPAEGGVARCLNPGDSPFPSTDAPLFEMVNTELPGGSELSGLWYAGGHSLWSIDTTASPMALYTYQDMLTVSPEPGSPADGAPSGRQTSSRLSWQAIPGATSYEVWYDTDPGFRQSPVRLYSRIPEVSISGLDSGTTYYWRVRAGRAGASLFAPGATIALGAPALSRFSATRSFTTALGAGGWSPFAAPDGIAPVPGATGIALRPNFSWNPADRAAGYELVLARDGSFSDVVVSRTGDDALPSPVWTCDTELDYDTTYYWKVRAVSPTSSSQWAAGIFTTRSAPASSPAPPAPPSPSPPADTPVSSWMMLAIVVLLVVVLLILVITTRRHQ